MKNSLFFLFSILLFFSCSKQQTFPVKISEAIGSTAELSGINASSMGLKGLSTFVQKFENKDKAFNIESFEKDWQIVAMHEALELNNENDILLWVKVTGLLLELTQKEKYAEELERISLSSDEFEKWINPYVLTKNLDNIYVNLFESSEIKYLHTLGGEVSIRQESKYPESGSVKLHFGMTERRHIALYIRIPEWAEGSSVIVKQVKYFGAPGTYCKIVKKWKEGDLVEIELPIEKLQTQIPNIKNQISN